MLKTGNASTMNIFMQEGIIVKVILLLNIMIKLGLYQQSQWIIFVYILLELQSLFLNKVGNHLRGFPLNIFFTNDIF